MANLKYLTKNIKICCSNNFFYNLMLCKPCAAVAAMVLRIKSIPKHKYFARI